MLHILLKNAAKKRSLLNLRKKERSLFFSDSLSALIPQNSPPPDTGFDGVTTGLRRGSEALPDGNYSHLRGKAIAELTQMDWTELDREFQRYGDFLKNILTELTRRSKSPTPTQLMMSGLSEVLRQPEFSEVHQIQTIVHLLEDEQDQIIPLIFEPSPFDQFGKRVSVRIGSENTLEPIRFCTLISSTYCKGTTPVGSVGMLGPTRMVYENAIALVEATADYISEAIS